jgi:hypothetical protein
VQPAGKFTLQIVAGVPEDISICIKTCRNHRVQETTEIGAMVRSSDIFRFRIPGDLKGVLADICFLQEGVVVANYADRILLDSDHRSKLINVTVKPDKIQHIEGNKKFPCRVVQKPDPLAVTMLDIKLDPLGSLGIGSPYGAGCISPPAPGSILDYGNNTIGSSSLLASLGGYDSLSALHSTAGMIPSSSIPMIPFHYFGIGGLKEEAMPSSFADLPPSVDMNDMPMTIPNVTSSDSDKGDIGILPPTVKWDSPFQCLDDSLDNVTDEISDMTMSTDSNGAVKMPPESPSPKTNLDIEGLDSDIMPECDFAVIEEKILGKKYDDATLVVESHDELAQAAM